MPFNARTVFALDAAGALLSVVLLGGVLPALQPWHGMPSDVLSRLALWATACLVYSLCGWRFAHPDDPRWLRGIQVLNTVYCVWTAALVVHHFPVLTPLGRVYFLAELPVILGLVAFEERVARRAMHPHSSPPIH